MPNESDQNPIPAPSAEFIENVTRVQRKLHAFIWSLVRSSADADDILQEANLVLWQKSKEFEPGTNFDAWAFRIAQFQVMAFRKRLQRSKLHFDDELVDLLANEAADVYAAEQDGRQRALAQCLQKLKPEQRRLVALRYEPGGCVNEIAAAQNRSPKAVSEALRRIRKALMGCIELTLRKEQKA